MSRGPASVEVRWTRETLGGAVSTTASEQDIAAHLKNARRMSDSEAAEEIAAARKALAPIFVNFTRYTPEVQK